MKQKDREKWEKRKMCRMLRSSKNNITKKHDDDDSAQLFRKLTSIFYIPCLLG